MSNKDRFELIGNTIAGTFRVDEVVAEGGFGVVYRAYHLHFRSPVALKCLKIPGELTDAERQTFLEQFRSEAEIQFRLSAALPNIVRPLHVDAVQSNSGDFIPFMALEWLDGRSFEKIIEHRTFSDLPPMPLSEAMSLIGPAAQALHQAHHFHAGGESFTVVHRDIKPDNLFVTEISGKKVVKLLDFGISKIRRDASQLAGHYSQTSGQAPFSPAYGAPEQWVPKRFGQTGPWTDVWGLALTLVEIVKGDAVIVGDHQAMMGTVLDPKKRPSPRQEDVSVSDEVESVFLKALSIDPRYRYQTIESFWEALQAALHLSASATYGQSPSGRRIRLPKMSAPTPWTPPNQALLNDPTPLGQLPPMMAPAEVEKTESSDVDIENSYPMDPNSDLQPVPAAPTSWDNFDPEIPPISEDFERKAKGEAEDSPALATPTSPAVQPKSSEALSSKREPSFKIELERVSELPEETPVGGRADHAENSSGQPPIGKPPPIGGPPRGASANRPSSEVGDPQSLASSTIQSEAREPVLPSSSRNPAAKEKPPSRRKHAVVQKREPSSPDHPVIPDLDLTPLTKRAVAPQARRSLHKGPSETKPEKDLSRRPPPPKRSAVKASTTSPHRPPPLKEKPAGPPTGSARVKAPPAPPRPKRKLGT